MKLYELATTYQEILEMDLEGEQLDEMLSILEDDVADKAENIAKVMRTLEVEGVAYDDEIKRLQAKKQACTKKSTRLKDYLDVMLKSMEIKKLDGKLFKFSYRKSESVKLTDESKLPELYVKTKTTTSADKTAIKKALKAGEVIEGAEIEVKQNLQIK